MNGAPLLRLALVVAALLALAWPLHRLTSPPPADLPAPAETPTLSPVRITLGSTRAPFHFRIDHLGQTLWEGDSSAETISRSLSLPFPPEGIDLWVEVAWKSGRPSALRVELTRAEHQFPPQFLWGKSRAGEVLTFR